FDNIIFGETSLGFGVLLLAAAFYLWRRGARWLEADSPVQTLAATTRPVSFFVGFLGLSLIAIAIAGIRYQLFASPPQEHISGAFAEYPMVEATFMSLLIALVGVGAIAFPFAVNAQLNKPARRSIATKIAGATWAVSGIILALFGAMNF